MFRATPQYDETVTVTDSTLRLKYYDRVETVDGFVPTGSLDTNSVVVTDEGNFKVSSVEVNGPDVVVTLEV